MSKPAKLLEKILLGTADANIPFDGLCRLLQKLGFQMRVRGATTFFTWRTWRKFSTSSPGVPAPSRIR
jgi:hypothetical protein